MPVSEPHGGQTPVIFRMSRKQPVLAARCRLRPQLARPGSHCRAVTARKRQSQNHRRSRWLLCFYYSFNQAFSAFASQYRQR